MALSWSLLLVLFKGWKVQSPFNCVHAKACEICSVYLAHPLQQYLGIPLIYNHLVPEDPKEGAIFVLYLWLLAVNFWMDLDITSLVLKCWFFFMIVVTASGLWRCDMTLKCGWILDVLVEMQAKCIWSLWLCVACPRGSCLIKKVLFCSYTIFLFVSFLELARWHHCIAVGIKKLLLQSLFKELFCKYPK